jgi:hypothetical protein
MVHKTPPQTVEAFYIATHNKNSAVCAVFVAAVGSLAPSGYDWRDRPLWPARGRI